MHIVVVESRRVALIMTYLSVMSNEAARRKKMRRALWLAGRDWF